MSDTYTGWDGKPYPWPPPEGWYHASDGRWWAPGTGPNPPAQGAQPPAAPTQLVGQGPDAGGPPAGQFQPPSQTPPPGQTQGPGVDHAAIHTAELSPDLAAQNEAVSTRQFTPPDQADQATAIFNPTDSGATAVFEPVGAGTGTGSLPHPDQTPPGGFGGPDAGTSLAPPPGAPPPRGGGPPAGLQPDAARKGGVGQFLLIVVGIVALVLAAGFAYFIFLDNGDGGSDTATADEATAEDGSQTSDTLGSGQQPDDDPDAASETTGPADGDTTAPDPTDNPDPTGEDSTTTTADDPDASSDTSEDASSTTAVEPESQVAEFRAVLADNDLTSTSLSDDNIVDFASNFCSLAEGADDAQDFDAVREAAVESSNSQLSPRELRLVINAAIVSFCPEQATRLGVDV